MNSKIVTYAQILLCFTLKVNFKKQLTLLRPFADRQTPWSNSEPQKIFKGNLIHRQGTNVLRRACTDKQSKEQNTYLVIADINQCKRIREVSFIEE